MAHQIQVGCEPLEPRRLLSLLPHGFELRAHTHGAGDQAAPAVAADDAGNFVVVWVSDGQDGSGSGVYAQRFTARGVKRGGELLVPAYTTGNQSEPAVAVDADGDFVVAWTDAQRDGSGAGVYARRFDASGAPRGDDVRVNTYTPGAQAHPDVAADDAGGFVVVWDDATGDGSEHGVFARGFAAGDGAPTGSPFRVNTSTTGRQWMPRVAMGPGGDFVVVWEGPDFTGNGVFAQAYHAQGNPLGAQFQPGGTRVGNQFDPDVAKDGEGGFVVVFTDVGADPAGGGDIWGTSYRGPNPQGGTTFRANALMTAGAQTAPAVHIDGTGEIVVTWEGDADAYAQPLDANRQPKGPPLLVNTFTAGAQSAPAVATSFDGDFVVVWASAAQDPDGSAGVFAQRFTDPRRPEWGRQFRVTDTLLGAGPPAVAASANGSSVLVWDALVDGAHAIVARRYDAESNPLGGHIRVSNLTTYTFYKLPSVAIDADGDFVVTWYQNGAAAADGYDVYARCFTSAGVPRGEQFRVNQYTPEDQSQAVVAAGAGGAFVVAWQDEVRDAGTNGIWARRFDPAGAPLGDEFRVNTYTTGQQLGPVIAADAAGNVVVAWTSHGQDGSGYGTFAQRIGADGAPRGAEFQVNQTTVHHQARPDVAAEPDGDFLIAWDDGGTFRAAFRRYNADGVPVTSERPVLPAGLQEAPQVALAPDGVAMIAWDEQFDGSFEGVFAQRFFPDGAPLGEPFRVNQFTHLQEYQADLSADGAGNFLATWRGQEPFTYDQAAFARRIGAATPPMVGAAQFHDETAPHELRFTFDRDVSASLGADDLTLVNLTTGQAISPGDLLLTYDVGTDAATFTYAGTGGALPDGRYRATLRGGGIADANGILMAADFTFAFTFLRGDANRDGRVNLQDFNILAANFGQPNRTFSQGDFNYDGRVNLQDFNLLAARFGQQVAPAGATAGAAPDDDDDLGGDLLA